MRQNKKAQPPPRAAYLAGMRPTEELGPMIETIYAVADLRAEAEASGLAVVALSFAAIEVRLRAKIGIVEHGISAIGEGAGC